MWVVCFNLNADICITETEHRAAARPLRGRHMLEVVLSLWSWSGPAQLCPLFALQRMLACFLLEQTRVRL